MGLSIDKIFVIMVIALIVVGPEKLPLYAKKLGEFVRTLRRMAEDAKHRLKDEMGEDFDPAEWQKLDPRQYDPRRIIMDALRDNPTGAGGAAGAAGGVAAGAAGGVAAGAYAGSAVSGRPQEMPRYPESNFVPGVVPFDSEAT